MSRKQPPHGGRALTQPSLQASENGDALALGAGLEPEVVQPTRRGRSAGATTEGRPRPALSAPALECLPESPQSHRPPTSLVPPARSTPAIPATLPTTPAKAGGLDETPAQTEADKPTSNLFPEAVATWNRQAAFLNNLLFPTQMLHALGVSDDLTVSAARVYLLNFRQDAGEPQDPVERVLLDQIAMSHLRVGRFHALAEETSNIELKSMYVGAATRLLREITRTVGALVTYRASLRQRDHDSATSGPSPKKKSEKQKGK